MPPPPKRERYNAKARSSIPGGSHKNRKRPSVRPVEPVQDEDEEHGTVAEVAEAQLDLQDLPSGLEGQRSHMSATKRKRLDSYINKKLKSADRLKTLQLLASLAPNQNTSENLVSTSSLGQYPGQGRSAKEREDLREDRLVRRGIDSLKRRFGNEEASSAEESDKSVSSRGPANGVSASSNLLPTQSDAALPQQRRTKKSKQASWNPILLSTQVSDSSSDSESSTSSGSDVDEIAEPASVVEPISRPVAKLTDPPTPAKPAVTVPDKESTGTSLPPAGTGSALKRSAEGTVVRAKVVAPRVKMPRGRDTPTSSQSATDDNSDQDEEKDDLEAEESGTSTDGQDSDADSEDDGPESDKDSPHPAPEKKTRSPGFKAWAQAQIGQTQQAITPNMVESPVKDENVATTGRSHQHSIDQGPRVGPLGSLEPIGQGPLAATLSQTAAGVSARPIIKRRSSLSEVRMALPIMAEEQAIVEAIRLHPVVIVVGETGSGKTTQVPQMLYEAGFGFKGSNDPGMIGITQPRRIAATSLAARVRTELDLPSSSPLVAHQIRYSSSASPETAIKFMTDGILLRELAADFLLSKYSVIVVDEAHERGVNTDVLIGVLSRVAKLREKRWKGAESSTSPVEQELRPLRIVIMSATLSLSSFTENPTLFATPPPVIHVSARQHPVTVHFSRRTSGDYVNEAYRKVVKIHQRLPVGGVLIFMTGQAEITGLTRRLEKRFGQEKLGRRKSVMTEKVNGRKGQPEAAVRKEDEERDEKGMLQDYDELSLGMAVIMLKRTVPEAEDVDLEIQDDLAADVDDGMEEADPDALDTEDELDPEGELASSDTPMHILPLYSLLPTQKQLEVFRQPPVGHRLIVIATNVAETSLTIPGIRYVVDSGRAKERVYDPATGVQTFRVQWISKASAQQRAGRAGRTGPGHVYRLYSSALYEDHFPDFALPEIQRMPVEGLVLSMKAMGIDKVVNFPFPTPPDRSALAKAEELLTLLGALSRTSGSRIVGGKMVAGEEGGKITELGREMSRYPLTPRWAKLLATGGQGACLEYVVAIVAGLSVGDPFVHENSLGLSPDPEKSGEEQDMEGLDDEERARAREKAGWRSENVKEKEEKKELKRRFFQAQSQFLSLGQGQSDMFKLLAAIGAYEHDPSFEFCEKHFLRHKAMQEIAQLRHQLCSLLSLPTKSRLSPPSATQLKILRQLLLSSSLDLIAVRLDIQLKTPRTFTSAHNVPYRALGLGSEPVYIHPASALYANGQPPEWVVYTDVVRTEKRVWLKGVTKVNPAWIAQLAGESGLISWSRAEEVPKGLGQGKGKPKGGDLKQGQRDVVTVPHLKGLGLDLPPVRKRQRREGTRWVPVD